MRHLKLAGVLLLLCLAVACSPAERFVPSPYQLLAERFDPQAAGHGLDAYTPTEASDHAMAYALVGSDEARWHALQGDAQAFDRAERAAAWLVENRDSDGDGLVGWGLPFAWDAFGDGSTNPAGWPYTITTALAIQGLLDVHDATRERELVDVALEATNALLDHAFTRTPDEAWFHYSPSEHDAYAVYNVSAMMLGQLQRLAAFEPTLEEVADLVAAHLLSARLVDVSGRVHWMYSAPGSPSADRENDLVHAAYIVQGLADYVRFGGRLTVDVAALYRSLRAFLMPGGTVSEMPHGDAPARDWGVGAALFTAALLEQELGVHDLLSRDFYGVATSYDPPDEKFYPRQAAHVLLGLALTSP